MDIIKLQSLTMAYTGEVKHKLYRWELEYLEADPTEPWRVAGHVMRCFQPIEVANGDMPQRWSQVGVWDWRTLRLHHVDHLFVDFGQDWYVKGMQRLIREVSDILYPVDTRAVKLLIHGDKYTLFDIEESAKVHLGTPDEHKFLYSPETVLALVDKIKELVHEL